MTNGEGEPTVTQGPEAAPESEYDRLTKLADSVKQTITNVSGFTPPNGETFIPDQSQRGLMDDLAKVEQGLRELAEERRV